MSITQITPLEGAQERQLAGDVPNTNISLYDEFNNPQGLWENYSTYDPEDQEFLINQAHVNIRSFNQLGQSINRQMTWFDTNNLSSLDGSSMTGLEGSLLIQSGEAWTNGTVGVINALNRWNGLQLNCSVGSNQTQSVITDLHSNRIIKVDISTGFADTDTISIALPNFPLSSVNTANSFVDFTSAADGSFNANQIDSVPFSASVTPLVNGHSELSFPRSTLTISDLTSITGVRFRIQATAPCTVTIITLKLIGPNWVQSSYDIDTLWDVLRVPASRNGDPTVIPRTMPIIWRGNVPASNADPRPIDVSMAITFSTGSLQGPVNPALYPSPTLYPSSSTYPSTNYGSQDIIDLYFRENTKNQYDQGSLELVTQADIDGFVQPDFGEDSIVGVTMNDLDIYQQQHLDSEAQHTVETKPNSALGSWIRVRLTFNLLTTSVQVQNTLGVGYSNYNLPQIQPYTTYILMVSLEGPRCQIEIYPLDMNGDILTSQPVFISGVIEDSFLFKSIPGRFGWQLNVQEGDFRVHNIRTRYVNLGEFRTRRFESVTPVSGVSLQVEGNIHNELFTGWSIGPYGGDLSLEPSDPSVHQILKITNTGLDPYQGIMSNLFYIENFDAMEIEFDLQFPGSSKVAPLKMFLLGEQNREIELPLVVTKFDQWQHINIHTITTNLVQTGPYRLCIVQPTTDFPTIWRIDNASIKERTIEWAARATETDAWENTPAPWNNFYNIMNSPNKGILLAQKDRFLQVRGKLLRQDGYISKLTVTPKYAELGRFVWADDPQFQTINMVPPTANFFILGSGSTRTFDGSSSTDLYGKIIDYEWNFGDGNTGVGPVATHTYSTSGVWTITLTIINDRGVVAQKTQTATT